MEEKKYYVYKHYIDDPDMPFYIGMGCGRRCRKGKRSGKWHNYVSNFGGKYNDEKIKIELTKHEAYKLEVELIKHYGRMLDGGILVNISKGGTGSVGAPMSDENKKKVSERSKGEKNPTWKGGITKDPKYGYKMKQKPSYKAKSRAYKQREDIKEKNKLDNLPIERAEKRREYNRKYHDAHYVLKGRRTKTDEQKKKRLSDWRKTDEQKKKASEYAKKWRSIGNRKEKANEYAREKRIKEKGI